MTKDTNNTQKELKEIRLAIRQEIKEKIEKLMDKKRAKKLGDTLELFYGERECKVCGTNPEKQREMILQSI